MTRSGKTRVRAVEHGASAALGATYHEATAAGGTDVVESDDEIDQQKAKQDADPRRRRPGATAPANPSTVTRSSAPSSRAESRRAKTSSRKSTRGSTKRKASPAPVREERACTLTHSRADRADTKRGLADRPDPRPGLDAPGPEGDSESVNHVAFASQRRPPKQLNARRSCGMAAQLRTAPIQLPSGCLSPSRRLGRGGSRNCPRGRSPRGAPSRRLRR
jgi:hypothetical protein